MDLIVGKSPNLHGSVKIPPNKSHSFRAMIMASLAEGTSRIISPAISNDWMLGAEAMEMFGAHVEPKAQGVWEITGTGGKLNTPEDIINCGNSGIILRFFTAMSACCEGYTILTGDHSLRHIRPCQPLIDALSSLGAWAVSSKGDGHAPLIVRGRLKGGSAEIDGTDSQPVSALLMACSLAEAPTDLIVHNPGEKPWVGVTLEWLKRCGVEFSNQDYSHYRVRGRSKWQGFEAAIALDWSAALYPIVAALITPDSEVHIPGMNLDDSQGDKIVVDVLRKMGADIQVRDGVVIARSSTLEGMTIDCNDFIDQFMLLAVVGACAQGQTVLTNASICRQKECDRITEVTKALKSMGADVQENPDGLRVSHSQLHGARIDSCDDHRMVMTMAVAALAADGDSIIHNTDCVKKTFPAFVEQMRGLGGDFQTR